MALGMPDEDYIILLCTRFDASSELLFSHIDRSMKFETLSESKKKEQFTNFRVKAAHDRNSCRLASNICDRKIQELSYRELTSSSLKH